MATIPTKSGSAAAIQRILAAARFAAEKHAQQKRKGATGEPYFNHLVEVAELVALSSDELDVELVMSAFLHDTVEDTGVTLAELEERFGSDVAGLVAEVTDDKSLSKETRKDLQVRNAHKKSVRAQILKLADKISNLRSILASPPVGWSLERKQQYFEWARQVVAGLTAPNPVLQEEFDKTYAMISHLQ
jgi:GTP diphosphokinase / guanosine-3',5'-bis(diphosphate) 3'-diphosphatase